MGLAWLPQTSQQDEMVVSCHPGMESQMDPGPHTYRSSDTLVNTLNLATDRALIPKSQIARQPSKRALQVSGWLRLAVWAQVIME